MRRAILGGLILTLVVTVTACPPVERDPAEVERGLDELREGYVLAYNQQDAEAVAQYYTTDAILVDADGTEVTGRDQLQQRLQQFMAQHQPQLSTTPIDTGSGDRLSWQYGTYVLELQSAGTLPMPDQPTPPPGTLDRPAPQQPGQPTQPTLPGQPAPGQPPGELQPGQPLGGPQLPQRMEGRYLIVLEPDGDRWLIRAHMNNIGMPTDPMGASQPPGDRPPGMPPADDVFPTPTERPPGTPPTEETGPPGEPPIDEPSPTSPPPTDEPPPTSPPPEQPGEPLSQVP